MEFSDAATIWMSSRAMNWPNAMTAKISQLAADRCRLSSGGSRDGEGVTAALMLSP